MASALKFGSVSVCIHPPGESNPNRNYQKLKDHGQPIHRKQLHRYAIEDMGLFVRGDNPVNNLTAHMSNDARFESTKGDGMWGLTEWRQGDTPKGYANRLETQRTALQAPSTRPSGSV